MCKTNLSHSSTPALLVWEQPRQTCGFSHRRLLIASSPTWRRINLGQNAGKDHCHQNVPGMACQSNQSIKQPRPTFLHQRIRGLQECSTPLEGAWLSPERIAAILQIWKHFIVSASGWRLLDEHWGSHCGGRADSETDSSLSPAILWGGMGSIMVHTFWKDDQLPSQQKTTNIVKFCHLSSFQTQRLEPALSSTRGSRSAWSKKTAMACGRALSSCLLSQIGITNLELAFVTL